MSCPRNLGRYFLQTDTTRYLTNGETNNMSNPINRRVFSIDFFL